MNGVIDETMRKEAEKVIQDEIFKFKQVGALAPNFELSKPMITELREIVVQAIAGGLLGHMVAGEHNLEKLTDDMYRQLMPLILGFTKAVEFMNKLDRIR